MAHYIGPDGRVVYFDADVKSDGSVRPRNYHEFAHDDIGGEDSRHSAEPAYGLTAVPTRDKGKSKYQSYYNTTPKQKKYTKLNKDESYRLRTELTDRISSVILPEDIKHQLSGIVSSLAPFKITKKMGKRWKERFSKREYYIILRTVDELNRIILKYRPSYKDEVSFFSKFEVSSSEADPAKPQSKSWYGEDSEHKEDEPPELKTSSSLQEKQPTQKQTLSSHTEPAQRQPLSDIQFAKETEKLLSESSLSSRAKSFITALTLKKVPIKMSSALEKKIRVLKLSAEENCIKELIGKYNDLCRRIVSKNKGSKIANGSILRLQVQRLFGDMSLGITLNSTASSTPKPQKKDNGIDNGSKGRGWVSGNYVRKGPKPKYGYARDRFGRVQERDSYREDRTINPYHLNSDYDREDDNDSLDSLD